MFCPQFTHGVRGLWTRWLSIFRKYPVYKIILEDKRIDCFFFLGRWIPFNPVFTKQSLSVVLSWITVEQHNHTLTHWRIFYILFPFKYSMKVPMCNRCRLLVLPFNLYAWGGRPGGGLCRRGVLMRHSSAAELQMRTQVRLLLPSALPVSLAAPLLLTDPLRTAQSTHNASALHTKTRSAFAASPVEH